MKKQNDIQLNIINGVIYYLKAIDKEINDVLDKSLNEFKKNGNCDDYLDINPSHIVAYGENKISEEFALKYIEYAKLPILECNEFKLSTRCYVLPNHKCNKNRLHYTGLESWKCALSILNNPKYVLIYSKNETIQR